MGTADVEVGRPVGAGRTGNVEVGADDVVASGAVATGDWVATGGLVVGAMIAVPVAVAVDVDAVEVFAGAVVDPAEDAVETSEGPDVTPGLSAHATATSPTPTAIVATAALTLRVELVGARGEPGCDASSAARIDPSQKGHCGSEG